MWALCQYLQHDANRTWSIAGLSFVICNLTNAPVGFPVIHNVKTMFTPISIPYKQPRELRTYEIPMSKKLISLRFIHFLYVSTIKLGKVGEKQTITSLAMWDREISTSGLEFNQGLGKPFPGSNSDPSGEVSLFYMGTHGRLL